MSQHKKGEFEGVKPEMGSVGNWPVRAFFLRALDHRTLYLYQTLSLPNHKHYNKFHLLPFRYPTSLQSSLSLSLSLVRRMGYKVEVVTKMSSATVRGSKRKVSCRKLGGYLREQKGRLYIIRRCVVMLICWHD